MNYRVNSPRSFWRSPGVIFLVGLGLIWLFGRPTIYRVGEGAALTLARPFWSLGAAVIDSAGQVRRFFSSRTEIINENERLRKALARFKAVDLERQRLTLDNEALRGFLNHVVSPSSETVTAARILTRPTQSPLTVIVADVGTETTRRPPQAGDLVIGAGVAAIGEVMAVYSRTVKIELYSGWGKKLEVLLGPERVPAEALGRGGGNFSISLPRDLAAVVGDPVMVIRGETEYLLGEVKMVNRDPASAFQEILFRSPVNLELLSWVEIHGS